MTREMRKEKKERKWKKRSAENARDREDRTILFILLRTINPFYLISFSKEDTLREILHDTVWALSWEKSLNGIEVSSRQNLWSFATGLKPVSFDSIPSAFLCLILKYLSSSKTELNLINPPPRISTLVFESDEMTFTKFNIWWIFIDVGSILQNVWWIFFNGYIRSFFG